MKQLPPLADMEDVSEIIRAVSRCPNLDMLKHMYLFAENISHPTIYSSFNLHFHNFGEVKLAKDAATKAAVYGIEYPSALFNNPLISSIGQSILYLLLKYPIKNKEIAYKASVLSYVYLSRCIEIYPNIASQAYSKRSMLFNNQEDLTITKRFFEEAANTELQVKPCIIADLCLSADIDKSLFEEHNEYAKDILVSLEETLINGKFGNEYSLEEIKNVGVEIHEYIYNTLKSKCKKGEFNITMLELQSMNY